MSLRKVLDALGLERDILVMVTAVLILTLGTQLWSKYVPKYLEFLGASALIIGLYGSFQSAVSALYQYPGGVLADKMGSKNALITFTFVSIVGLLIYLFSPDWRLFLLGTFFVLTWESMSQPAIFSLIGDVLKKSRRAIGFSVQSILKRIPIILAPPIGGYLIETYGIEGGMRIGFTVSIVLALIAIVFQKRFYSEAKSLSKRPPIDMGRLWTEMRSPLKRLLVADIAARLASNTVKVYVVLYVLNILGASPLQYGLLISVQMITSILSYLPAAKLADIYGRKPFVALTFTFFALFPAVLITIPGPSLLPLAFIINGLREIGEPARKALIVDLAEGPYQGRTIGLYYLIRESIMIPASLIGGLLWSVSPQTPFIAASMVGSLGVLIFLTSKKHPT